MHDTVRDSQQPGGSPTPPPKPNGLLQDFAQLAQALRHLFGAQLHLLAAELGLARSAVSWLLATGLIATVAAVGLGLTGMAFLGLVLARWLHSWIEAMAAMALIELLVLVVAIVVFRRCMHWMSLPGTRHEWRAMMRDSLFKAGQDVAADKLTGRDASKG